MNLTRINAGTLSLSNYSGSIRRELENYYYNNSNNNGSSGNYWVDWAIYFVQEICINTLGLEVRKGPGTSIGVIHQSYGPIRYQYDCDWTQEDGRVPGLDEYEIGFTFWKGITPWGSETEPSPELSNYGIDINNKRFDFIVWFTSESNDDRDSGRKEGERLGLRFKYPLTCEMGYGTVSPVGMSPACIPWKAVNTAINNYHYNENSSKISARMATVTDCTYSGYLTLGNSSIASCNGLNNSTRKTWSEYNKDNYSNLFTSDQLSPASFGGTTRTIFDILYSYDYSTINLKIYREVSTKVNNQTVETYPLLLDILYGDLVEEQLGDSKFTTNSFVMIKNANSDNNMGDFLITESNDTFGPKKQINRPISSDNSIQTYCGISRLLLQKESVHCKSLYQVFSFNNLMDSDNYIKQVFVDKNDDQHAFLLFNYGRGVNTADRMNSVCLAIPVSNGG